MIICPVMNGQLKTFATTLGENNYRFKLINIHSAEHAIHPSLLKTVRANQHIIAQEDKIILLDASGFSSRLIIFPRGDQEETVISFIYALKTINYQSINRDKRKTVGE